MKIANILLLILLGALQNQAYSQIMPEKSAKDWEVWYDKVPVSGEIRVGLMEDFTGGDLQPKTIYVLIPDKSKKYLCVEISSRDGRYKANREFKIEKLKIGSNQLIWPTNHTNELQNFNKQDLTILCSIGETCDDNPDYYTLASWSKGFDSDTFHILLNSEKPPTISIKNMITKNNVDIECEKLELSPMITFNCKCDIPKNLITQNSEMKIVKRVRKINRITYKRYPLPIKLLR